MNSDLVYLVIVGGAAIILSAIIGWRLWAQRTVPGRSIAVPEFSTPVSLKPMLSEAEAQFYNLLKLAVQDRYLVFAHVPLWCFIDFQIPEGKARVSFLSQLALKRATFVLVHPGTRRVEKAVEWQAPAEPDSSMQRSDSFVRAVLKAAGVHLLMVDARNSYSVADLTSLLDIGQE